MIKGIHGMLLSSDPDATRAFFRDKVKLPGSDIGGGWWIFDFAQGDLGVHPADRGSKPGTHDVSLYCDDIASTVADMKKRGVVFTQDVADHGYGLVTYFEVPGGITIQLYEPRYQKRALKTSSRAKPKSKAKPKSTTKTKSKRKAAPKKKVPAPRAKKRR
jgi:catechol 2,3-dioxygenase-like lactoylglutathione lyase family enzyme